MKRLLVAAMLLAMGAVAGAGAVQAREPGSLAPAGAYQGSHFVPPGALSPSDDSYGKHLAAQYNTANGE